MDRTTHAKITINDAGETEVRQLNVVGEARPGQRQCIVSIDVSRAIERINQESTNDPNEPDGFDADVDGIDPEHYEQPPRLSAQDETILDRTWDRHNSG